MSIRDQMPNLTLRSHDIAGECSRIDTTKISALLGPLLAATAYYVAAKLGAALAFPSAPVSAFWAPNALLLAALLLAPARKWWLYLAAVLPLHVLAQASSTPEQIAIQYIVNCGEALIGAAALARHQPVSRGLDSFSAITNLIVIGGIIAPLVTSVIMTAAFVPLGLTEDPALTIVARTITNTFATITVVPLVLLGARAVVRRKWPWSQRKTLEALFVGALLISMCLYVFVPSSAKESALLYAPLPLLIYATVRFGLLGVCGSALLLGALATWGVLHDTGPFVSHSPVQNALAAVFYLNVTCIPLLLLAAVLEERRHAASALAKREILHRSIMASLRDQIAVLDSRGVVLEANDSWLQSPEHVQEDACARPGDTYLAAVARKAALGDTVATSMHEALSAVLSGQAAVQELEVPILRADGPHWFELSIERLQHPERGAVMTLNDITARRRAEVDVHEHQQRLAHLARAAILGEFSGAVAHEIRQPLTAVQANAEAAASLLTMRPLDKDELQEIISDIVTHSQRAAQVIQRLQSMLRKTEPRRTALRLNELVKDSLILARADLARRHVRIHTTFASELPNVLGDPVQIQQIILNLIANACDAMAQLPEETRRLTLATRLVEPNLAEISVADCGTGIAEDQLERIFEPFVTTKGTGLGLGLSICRTIAAAHGGRLWAERLAVGARFHLTLPTESAEPAEERAS